MRQRSDEGRKKVTTALVHQKVAVEEASVQLQVTRGLAVKKEKRTWGQAGRSFLLTSPFIEHPFNRSRANEGFDYHQHFRPAPVIVAVSWAAVSNSSFITIVGSGSHTGSGIISYTVAPNTKTDGRTGTLTIAGQTFTVTQAGAAPPTPLKISPIVECVTDNGDGTFSAWMGYSNPNPCCLFLQLHILVLDCSQTN